MPKIEVSAQDMLEEDLTITILQTQENEILENVERCEMYADGKFWMCTTVPDWYYRWCVQVFQKKPKNWDDL